MSRSRITRVSAKFNNELTRMSQETGVSKVKLTESLGAKLKSMKYRRDLNVFKEPDLYDSLFPPPKKKNKRGSMMDVFFIVAAFFVLAISGVITAYVLDAWNTEVQADADISADAKVPIADFEARYPTSIDNGIVLALIAAHISIIILGLSLRSLPLLFPVLMVVLLVTSILSGYIANSWNDDIASDTTLQPFANEFPMTSYILDNYVIITLVWGFLDIIIFLVFSSYRGVGV